MKILPQARTPHYSNSWSSFTTSVLRHVISSAAPAPPPAPPPLRQITISIPQTAYPPDHQSQFLPSRVGAWECNERSSIAARDASVRLTFAFDLRFPRHVWRNVGSSNGPCVCRPFLPRIFRRRFDVLGSLADAWPDISRNLARSSATAKTQARHSSMRRMQEKED